MESNPVGRWIMGLTSQCIEKVPDDSQIEKIAVFVSLKFIGTLLVTITLQALYLWRKDWSTFIALNLAGFQLGLFAYLVL